MSAPFRKFDDILEPRRGTSDFLWVSRELCPKYAWEHSIRLSPEEHKAAVLKSIKIQNLIDKLAKECNIDKGLVEKQVEFILDEIGYKKTLKIIRWLGLVGAKILKKTYLGIYVNTVSINQLKTQMGHCPIIFVPSHRSYADFILMSYICFHSDIAIPAIAAGMDFHGMMGMGTILRHTGAFFMRRSYSNDNMYWTIFKQYVYQLVTKGDLPIEFFIEGTRSRSGKSLPPKYGLLLMVLKAFFVSSVPDIIFIPINISYDRVLEEKLFAFELLGVPKPKETTKGFFKSLSIIKEQFGKMFINFGQSISTREYFKNKVIDRTIHNKQPEDQRELTDYEKSLIPSLAYEIIYKQQKYCVITTFNLAATILNYNLSTKQLLFLNDFIIEVNNFKKIMERYGAYVDDEPVETSLEIHKNFVGLNSENKVSLIWTDVILDKLNSYKLKAHKLTEKTISYAVPYIWLQIYVNPIMHYLIDSAVLVLLIEHFPHSTKETLFGHYSLLRGLLNQDFVTCESRKKEEFDKGLKDCLQLNLIEFDGVGYKLGTNKSLQQIHCTVLNCFIYTYYVICEVLLLDTQKACGEKIIQSMVQEVIENKMNLTEDFIHPYSLSLDSITNFLNGLANEKILNKRRENNQFVYEVNENSVLKVREFIKTFVKGHYVNEDLRNFKSKL